MHEVEQGQRSLITSPGQPATNDGYDNENYDLIVYRGDIIRDSRLGSFRILDRLGNGTFGQVYDAMWLAPQSRNEINVAIKISKSYQVFFDSSTQEARILEYVCFITRLDFYV